MSKSHSNHSSPRHLSVHGRIVTQNSTLSRELLHPTGSVHSQSGNTAPSSKHSVSVSALNVVPSTDVVTKRVANNATNIADVPQHISEPSLHVLESNINQETNTVAKNHSNLEKEFIRSGHTSGVGKTNLITGLDRPSYTQLKSSETGYPNNRNSSVSVIGGGDVEQTTEGIESRFEDPQITLRRTNNSDDYNPDSYEHNRLKNKNKNHQAPASGFSNVVDVANRSDVHLLNVGLTFNPQHRALTQQYTGLSLHSQSKPIPVDNDERLKSIPPLDLRNLTPSVGSDDENFDSINYSPPTSYHQQTLGLKEFDSKKFSNLNIFDHPSKSNLSSSNNFRPFDEAGQDTYRDRNAGPEHLDANRSDLADDLTVPFPFDTQALTNNTNRSDNPPSPPVQTTPPPEKEPVTSLRGSSSQVYAVSNPDIQRAQETSQYRQTSSKGGSQEVKFSAGSRKPASRDYQNQDLDNRAPTPYARSPKRDLPPSTPKWEPPREVTEKTASAKSKVTLPPQHPPLDTIHTPKPESREKAENGQIKRVYVESPSFTKEEEEEYRFVSSRLEDIEEKNTTTFREMDPNRRGYGGDDYPVASYGESRSRKVDSGRKGQSKDKPSERYENRNTNKRPVNGEKDRYEDRSEEMNGDSDFKGKNNRAGGSYKSGDGYDRLKQDRAEFDREPRREDETNLRGLRKQNTEMDERDLRLEAEYQRDLKRRIEKNKEKDLEPRYARRESYDKENDNPRDSLEYSQDRAGFARDSLDYNGFEQQDQWGNPPSNPYQEDMRYYQMELAKQDSKPDFYDADDVERMEIVNPKAPKYDYIEKNKQDYGMLPRKTYRDIEHKKKEEEEKLDHIFITPKVQPKKKHGAKKAQSAQPQHMGYQPPEQFPVGFKPSSAEELWAKRAAHLSDKKESAQGNKPTRELPGRSGPKRWNTNPQVKQAQRFEPPAPLPNQGQLFKPLNAYQPNQQTDDAGYSQNLGGYGTPTRLQPLENKPAPPVATELQPTAVQPSSPFRRHMELKPITQEIMTEDGQRISVDINLRLISPPPGQSGARSPPHHQHQLALVPVQDTQPPGDHHGYGVPYQMQDQYMQYDYGYQDDAGQYSYNTGAPEQALVPYHGEPRLTQEELELADPSGYSKRFNFYKDDEISNTELKSLEEGYAALYHKMKTKDPSEHPWYKVYNINDYKKMQREVRLNRGTLGPDLDTESYKDKMEKRHKQFEYARMVMEKNRQELGVKKPPKFPKQPEKPGEEGVKRKTALEYAKNVPKPQTKPRPNQYNSYEVAAQLTPGSPGRKGMNLSKNATPQGSTQTMDVIDIHTLEQRHLQERRTADKIRQNMDSVLTQKAH
ncbi:uncharacterized protein LOC127861288 isoform X1 [Dreissena polymorpha]|uniref:Uncharacterized protein n=1 Tax=Dreissena polymorpha TaxID=45954 RepID=A0A9D3YSK4_DREPO|nr:uncharacterized protein LOC127861288 isoform X1 [Dreissena polymorpha]XP_052255697.1 uncharacterized protein LOC127861288 isoform X1 [Dreissena polymorpha]KAH3703781.1 hypothetical protein DPMN_078828 [Dreissena polymorpha]